MWILLDGVMLPPQSVQSGFTPYIGASFQLYSFEDVKEVLTMAFGKLGMQISLSWSGFDGFEQLFAKMAEQARETPVPSVHSPWSSCS